MKLTELKNWDKLTKEEQDRLKEMYGEEAEITKTMAQPAPEDPENPQPVEPKKEVDNG